MAPRFKTLAYLIILGSLALSLACGEPGESTNQDGTNQDATNQSTTNQSTTNQGDNSDTLGDRQVIYPEDLIDFAHYFERLEFISGPDEIPFRFEFLAETDPGYHIRVDAPTLDDEESMSTYEFWLDGDGLATDATMDGDDVPAEQAYDFVEFTFTASYAGSLPSWIADDYLEGWQDMPLWEELSRDTAQFELDSQTVEVVEQRFSPSSNPDTERRSTIWDLDDGPALLLRWEALLDDEHFEHMIVQDVELR